MNEWDVYWMDGSNLRVTRIPAYDIYTVGSSLGSYGIYDPHSIIRVERVAQRAP